MLTVFLLSPCVREFTASSLSPLKQWLLSLGLWGRAAIPFSLAVAGKLIFATPLAWEGTLRAIRLGPGYKAAQLAPELDKAGGRGGFGRHWKVYAWKAQVENWAEVDWFMCIYSFPSNLFCKNVVSSCTYSCLCICCKSI